MNYIKKNNLEMNKNGNKAKAAIISIDSIRKYMPSVYLTYVDYRENLNEKEELLQECIKKNSEEPLMEYIEEVYSEERSDNAEKCVMETIGAMINNGICSPEAEEDEEFVETVRDLVYDSDESDPVNDLLSNTFDMNMFYSVGYRVEGNDPYQGRDDKAGASEIVRLLGLDESETDSIEELLDNCWDGGEVRIYFRSNPKAFINPEIEPKSIRFSGTITIAVVCSSYGSGWHSEIKGDVALEFNRDNLFIDNCVRYSFCDDICGGLVSDWTTTKFSLSTEEPGLKVEKSELGEYAEEEKKLDAIFKNGKCTEGDMKMSRHHHVEYRNAFPCGWVCKDCGTFWID